MDKHKECNGWSNWFTWNVALWVANDYNLFLWAREYSEQQQKLGLALSYDEFLEFVGIPKGTRTPDGVAFHSPNVNRQEMREELANL